MTIYYIKQDNTIWGCGDPACCGEYFEEIEESFLKCDHKNVDAEHLHSCNGGGPVLEWRKANTLEAIAYEFGNNNSYGDGWTDGNEYATEKTKDLIIRLLQTEANNSELESKFGGNVQSNTIQWCINFIKDRIQ